MKHEGNVLKICVKVGVSWSAQTSDRRGHAIWA